MDNYYPEIEHKIKQIADKIQPIIYQNINSNFKIILATLYKRIINGYYSIDLLLANGFNLEALTVMRSVIEAKIVMSSLIKEPNKTFEKLRLLTEKNRRKSIENAGKLDCRYKEFNIEHLNKKPVFLKDFADIDIDNNELRYDYEYSDLCNIVHINKRSIEIMLNEKNGKIILEENISIYEVQPLYNYFVSEITSAFLEMYQQFEIEIDDSLKKLIDLSKNLLRND